jgi:primary-amine oxidase
MATVLPHLPALRINETPHPLSALSIEETNLAREIIQACYPNVILDFRQIWLLEPPKSEVIAFLEIERTNSVSTTTPRPQRLAQLRYDVISGDKIPEYHESVVDLRLENRCRHDVISTQHHASLTM